MSYTKADEPTEMLLGAWTRVVPRNHVFDGGPHRPREGSSFFSGGGEGGGRDKCDPLPTEKQHDAVVEQAPAHAQTVNDRAPVFQRRRRRRCRHVVDG